VKDKARFALAQPKDCEHLPDLERAAATLFSDQDLPLSLKQSATSLETLRAAQASQRLWVAFLESPQPVGFMLITSINETQDYIEELSIHSDYTGKGIGKAFLAHVEIARRTQGVKEMWLTTFEHVPWNGPFYARMGYENMKPEHSPRVVNDALKQQALQGLSNRVTLCKRLH